MIDFANDQSMSGELRPACKPRAHNNQTGRWLTPFKVCFFSLFSRVSDPHFFFADPDPGKNFHADPDPDPDPGSTRGREEVVKRKMKFFFEFFSRFR